MATALVSFLESTVRTLEEKRPLLPSVEAAISFAKQNLKLVPHCSNSSNLENLLQVTAKVLHAASKATLLCQKDKDQNPTGFSGPEWN